MQITKRSIATGVEHTREINVTPAQLATWMASNTPIQIMFPNLSTNDREFILTGMTPEEWDDVFKEREELEEADKSNPFPLTPEMVRDE